MPDDQIEPQTDTQEKAAQEIDELALALESLSGPKTQADAPKTEEAGTTDDLESFLNQAAEVKAKPMAEQAEQGGETDLDAFMQTAGIVQTRDVPDITKPWMKCHKFERVETLEKVIDIVEKSLEAGHCSLDLETEGLDNRITWDALGNVRTVHQIVGYCISYDGITGYYLPVRHRPADGGDLLNLPVEETEAQIRRLCLASQPKAAEGQTDLLSFQKFSVPPTLVIFFWNAKFDQEFLYPITGIDWWHPDSFEDGYLAMFCHYSADKALSLKHKAPLLLRDPEGNAHVMIEIKELFPNGRPIDFAALAPSEPGVIKYACSDAINTFLLCMPPRPHEKDRPDVIKLARSKYAFTYRLEKQTTQCVRVMERNRAKIDRAAAREMLAEYETERASLLKKIQDFASSKGFHGLDPNSTQQISDFLFTDKPGCMSIKPAPEKNEASGQYKTDAETLNNLVEENPHAPPILKWFVDFRGVEKMLGTYLRHLVNNPDKNDELRFDFKQTGAGTGRFSAPARADHVDHGFAGVPVHGIPNESTMRKVFLARDGYTIAKCDYAGQELRIVANLSGEEVWIKEFMEGTGDLHSITARAFFNKAEVSKDERKMGKIANFALIYGGGPAAIMRATGCDKVEGARRKQAFDKSVPTFALWIKKQHASVKKDLGIFTAFKRWLAIPDANHPDRAVQAACERYSTNYPIQGSGADIMKIAMVVLHKEFHKRGWLRNGGDDSVRMLLTVHDEVVFEIKHERVCEAIPVIVQIMESPAKMATPQWRIPLIVEPLIGPNWGSGYKCEHAKKDSKIGKGEYLINGFIYGTYRKAEKGDKAGVGEEGIVKEENGKSFVDKIHILDPAWLRGRSTDDVSGPAAPPTGSEGGGGGAPPPPATHTPSPQIDAPVELVEVRPKVPSAPPPKPVGKVVVMKIHKLTGQTVKQVGAAVIESHSADGKLLRLTDNVGAPLVDPASGPSFMVDPKKLADALVKLNLSDGEFTEEP